MGLVQEHLDVGDPEQVKLFDEAMGTRDDEERVNKFLRILSNYLAQAKGSGSATAQNERLLEDLETAIFLLHRVQESGSPNQIVADQITRLERRWPSLNGEGSFGKLKAQLERLPRLKIEIESVTSADELRAHCFELILSLQLCAMVNDHVMKRQEEMESEIEAMRVQGQVQGDMIDALKAENGELLKASMRPEQEDVESLKLEKAGLVERAQAQEKEIEGLKAALKQEKAKRKAMSNEIAELKASVKQGKANGESQRKEIEALRASLEQSKALDELVSVKDKEIAELQVLLKKDEVDKDGQIAELVGLLEKEKKKRESQQQEIDSMKTQIEHYKANSDSLSAKDKQIAELRARLSQESRNDELKQEEARQKLIKELKALRTENTRLQSELQKTKILEQKLESARTAQEDALNKQRSSAQKISVQLDDKTHEVEALTAANEKLATKLAKKRQQKIDLATQNAQLTLDLQEAHSSIQRLQTQVDSITAKNEETQKSVSKLRETMATLSSDYETVCSLCDSLKQRYRASQDKQHALKEKLAYLQTANGLSDMRSEYSAMKQRYEELSLKSESAKAKVRGMVESAVRLVCQKFASAIGETFGSAASGDELDGEINELADRIRVINSRSSAVLRKPRTKRPPLLPSMDELDREIENLKHNIIH